MCGSREWYLGVVSFRAWRALILSNASTNIRLTATAAFIHCVYVCQYEGMRDHSFQSSRILGRKKKASVKNKVV